MNDATSADRPDQPDDTAPGHHWVEVEFDCLPLRSMARLGIPLDASPALEAMLKRIHLAAQKHGTHNTYYLHRGRCGFHLTNDPRIGWLGFRFQGTVLTDATDRHTVGADLEIELAEETCEWLEQSIVDWFQRTVSRAVEVEFDRYIQAGDLAKAQHRLEQLERQEDAAGGYLGMYL